MKRDLNMDSLVSIEGDYVIITIPLHLFRHNMESLAEIVIPLIEEGKRIVVDTAECPYPSTEVIEILLRMLKLYTEKNSEYKMPIVNSSTNWKKVFKIVNIDSLFGYYNSTIEAKEYYEKI